MPATPLFSVIIPTYQRAQLLPRAIASVLAQTCPDWELVVVDDGSTDPTAAVVQSFQQQGRPIRYHWQPNAGRGGVRNTGIDLAQGRYLCFLDDDDYYLPHHLEAMAAAINSSPDKLPAVVRTEGYLQRDGQRHPLPPLQGHPLRFVWEKGASCMFFAFLRSEAIHHRFAPDLVFSEDTDFIVRMLASHHQPLAYTRQPTVVQVDHPARVSRTRAPAEIQQILQSRLQVSTGLPARYPGVFSTVLTRRQLQARVANDHRFAGNLYFRAGCYRAAWWHWFTSFTHPFSLRGLYQVVRFAWVHLWLPNR